MVIYKYRIGYDGASPLMPQGAKVVHVGEQNGDIYLWASVNPNMLEERRTFTVVGTGHKAPPDSVYVGTVQIHPFVWHVFEEK
jgi:hypothetical protein